MRCGYEMARTLENTGYQWEVYDDDFMVARIVPHDFGNWLVARPLISYPSSIRSYETPELAADYLPELCNRPPIMWFSGARLEKRIGASRFGPKSTRVTCGQPQSPFQRGCGG